MGPRVGAAADCGCLFDNRREKQTKDGWMNGSRNTVKQVDDGAREGRFCGIQRSVGSAIY